MGSAPVKWFFSLADSRKHSSLHELSEKLVTEEQPCQEAYIYSVTWNFRQLSAAQQIPRSYNLFFMANHCQNTQELCSQNYFRNLVLFYVFCQKWWTPSMFFIGSFDGNHRKHSWKRKKLEVEEYAQKIDFLTCHHWFFSLRKKWETE